MRRGRRDDVAYREGRQGMRNPVMKWRVLIAVAVLLLLLWAALLFSIHDSAPVSCSVVIPGNADAPAAHIAIWCTRCLIVAAHTRRLRSLCPFPIGTARRGPTASRPLPANATKAWRPQK